ncbi:cysteine hydrolase family protein [Robbsia andropogonis]|uniref:cysteine hydrolase family protein n=1 Tax=Robbsia andropogonis TaxID=28092 RepID=UPI003132AB06
MSHGLFRLTGMFSEISARYHLIHFGQIDPHTRSHPVRPPLPQEGTLLLLIDLQKAIDDPSWGVRNNPSAEANIVRLLTCWRTAGWPVWHVRHDSTNPVSTYRPGQSGNEFKTDTAPVLGEPVITKNTNSAFIGTDLENRLRADGHHSIVIAGVITNNSVESTVRMGGNLGFDVYLVSDGCFTFSRVDWNGNYRSAEDVHAMALANMHPEYCNVVTVDALLHNAY